METGLRTNDELLIPTATARRARVALIFVVLVTVAGIYRISINADPSRLVASTSERSQAYASLLKDFPGEGHQVLVFTEAPAFDIKHLRRYEASIQPLYDLPEVQSVGSLFSVPSVSKSLRRIIKNPASTQSAEILTDIRALLKKPDFLLSRLVSANDDALLMTVTLKPTAIIDSAILHIEQVLNAQYPASSGIQWSLAGNPVIESAIARDVMSELLRVTLIAIICGALVAWWVLRRLIRVTQVMVVPITAVVCSLGLMGWFSISLTLLSQAVLTVVFLVVFTDTLHAVHSQRSRASLLLACGLTSITTGVAAIALLFASSLVVREFAWALLLGIGAGFLVWSLWLLSNFHSTVNRTPWRGADGWRLRSHHRPAAMMGLAFTMWLLLMVPASQLSTGFSFDENLPKAHDASAALTLAETRFSGYLPLQIVVSSEQSPPNSAAMVKKIAALQNALNTDQDVRWYSIVDVLEVTPGFGIRQRLSALPASVRRGLWKNASQAVLFSPRVVNELLESDSAYLSNLDQLVQQHASAAGLRAEVVTGLPALVKEASQALIPDAMRSLLIMIGVLVMLVMGVLKSFRLALISSVPVVFTITGLAASLVLLSEPLRHAGVVMMTIAVGLSIDNAMHLIVAVREAAKQGNAHALTACEHCLPVLWTSTIAIVTGFVGLTLSDIPSLSILGLATAASLAIGFVVSAVWLPQMLAASNHQT